ncbi:hypothetical protein J3R30DRAFT_3445398 [Lentinula aciculospora]|uniref:Uncharacterized protein n=1 Tax=Lentinula aciculospora TaxID=153920 RepID=A0A9W9DU38_9AGAR|nr:hypothetical protein J3R30DRAFT_3445398 [Lentinula aciculospora]
MPSSTLPFEILFDLINDMSVDVVFEITPLAPGRISKNVLLGRGRSVSLVLNAGSTYRYMLLTSNRASELSVQSWNDIRCTASSAISGSGLPSGLSCKTMEYELPKYRH